MKEDDVLWLVRHFVYSHIADTTRPPSVDETATHFGISVEEASELYKELHNRHALFLDVAKVAIRMANPFSGISTGFKVHANGRIYFANCAWDMLGIPAALHCEAVIDAVCTESNDTVRLEIKDGQIINHQLTDSQLLIHFPLPFARWYDDLVFT
jgi:hypothetical protein